MLRVIFCPNLNNEILKKSNFGNACEKIEKKTAKRFVNITETSRTVFAL